MKVVDVKMKKNKWLEKNIKKNWWKNEKKFRWNGFNYTGTGNKWGGYTPCTAYT